MKHVIQSLKNIYKEVCLVQCVNEVIVLCLFRVFECVPLLEHTKATTLAGKLIYWEYCISFNHCIDFKTTLSKGHAKSNTYSLVAYRE